MNTFLHFYQYAYVELDLNSRSLSNFQKAYNSLLGDKSAKIFFSSSFSVHSLRLKKNKRLADRPTSLPAPVLHERDRPVEEVACHGPTNDLKQ